MKNIDLKEMKEIIQSSHLNFLIGAGLSTPFLPVLNDIEVRLRKETEEAKKIDIYKEYVKGVMLPNKDVLSSKITRANNKAYNDTFALYETFLNAIAKLMLKRKSAILSKQANVFTTNIDVMLETILENNNLNYNDGFAGQLNPSFSISNLKKSVFKRSLHYDNISEIPIFNIIKVHGSLTWRKDADNRITYSKLSHFDDSLLSKNAKEFLDSYKKILIVNPEMQKFEETVLDSTYYELLRVYSSELEKENVVLFTMGFSFADEHISEITKRSANSNPTLKVYVFCYKPDEVNDIKQRLDLDNLRYSNISMISPQDHNDGKHITLDEINKSIYEKLIYDEPNT